MSLFQRTTVCIAYCFPLLLAACMSAPHTPTEREVAATPKQQVVELLKSFETGDREALSIINASRYIQHNLGIADGREALEARLNTIPKGSLTVHTVRVFQDGNYVFAQTEYDFAVPRIGFDIFRFENGKIVEHWDNLQEKAPQPSPSGHTMTDGPTAASELEETEANRELLKDYMDDLLSGRRDRFAAYFDGNNYIQHSPLVADNLTGLIAGLTALAKQGLAVKYQRVHQIRAEGNFVLVTSDGLFGPTPSAYYDLYRIQNGKIAEHWDTIQPIPPQDQWKNANGKF